MQGEKTTLNTLKKEKDHLDKDGSFRQCRLEIGQFLDVEKLMEYLWARGKLTKAEYADYSAKFFD